MSEKEDSDKEPLVPVKLQDTPPIKKYPRRSPTTGHRRKKQEIKRSHSSPREKFEISSEDDEKEKSLLVRRNSVEDKPKKTLRRRLKTKIEKSEESSKESDAVKDDNIEEDDDDKQIEFVKLEKPKDDEENLINSTPEQVQTSSSSWWSKWMPSWSSAKAVEQSKESIKVEEIPTVDDNDLNSEFATLVSQTESKILKEIESQIVTDVKAKETVELEEPAPPTFKSFSQFIKDTKLKFKIYKEEFPEEVETLKKLRNRCISELVIIMIFCGLGGLLFKFVEGAFESFYKCGVKRVKRDFIDDLWRGSHYLREDEWKSKARRKLMEFENQLQEAFEAGMTTYSGRKSWSFINAVIYCLTVITTIGYGHIAPVTTTGRALTIAYSIIGIPLFLILLADFGKLFTRGIKFIWAFVRRLYYTGSCKKVRRTAPVQEVMKGVQMVYDMALLRRPSQMPNDADNQVPPMTPVSIDGAPSTPALSAYAIDDEFNLPISVAIVILLIYIFMGAAVFYIWETDWTFFDAFYFVFISMSTIGFGDLVPANQMYMMASIVYLAFGLALTSMCINVVQEKLSDTFRQASAKIGATIGLKVCEDDGTVEPASPTHVEIAEVHKSPSTQT
ncbi:hypothetical protein O3M35_012633 [Rhynocoris fuscipes]|uniref:Potassium channel domain-containing protein n=1 Tax=Rhynocoris fuscipes TaxID=488301 RepID=A0AAW1CYR7_9HEMI